MTSPSRLVFVGGGPRTVGLLERLAANSPELLGPGPLTIHVVDPFRAGGGRIWRTEQSDLLWMNSMARDVTMFTDESVTCAGPIVPGPALDAWVHGEGRDILAAAGLSAQAAALRPDDFASRQIQSQYLSWAYGRAVAGLPERVTVIEHRVRAVGLTDDGQTQTVQLADGSVIRADVVVLAQGYLDRRPTGEEAAFIEAAAGNDALTYIAPGYTADVDLSDLRAGEPVLVRGFGLAFVDLMVLLGEGRGGRFEENADGSLRYVPSGAEPVLYVGSRRGVPYHAKLGYARQGPGPTPPRYFTPAAVAALGGGRRVPDFRDEIWPLIAKELTFAHYRELFSVHPQRTTARWQEFSALIDASDVRSDAFRAAVAAAVPAPADRFDLPAIDRPLEGRFFGGRADLTDAVVEHIRSDLARRADPAFSADAAVFDALLTVYGVLAVALTSGQVSPSDRIRYVEGQFHGFFSFLASGPPPRRLAELLALHDAGLVHFAGPELRVTVDADGFTGWSPAAPDVIRTKALVDARLPRPDVRLATDPVISSLLARGELAAENLTAPDGRPLEGGQLLADSACRAISGDLSVHPRRFLLGPSVSGSAGSAGFARPGFNGPGFRQNDTVARELLRLLHHPARSETPSTSTPATKEIHHAR